MKKRSETILVIVMMLLLHSCGGADCSKLPNSFSNYEEAISMIKGASFELEKSANTSNSSWIDDAEYYSCNGFTGYLIFETEGRSYIHEQVPIEIWTGFENADSKGEYYNNQIKHHYRLVPSN